MAMTSDPTNQGAPKSVEDKPADLPAATAITPAGVPEQTTDVDLNHPAVDANPRANTSETSNRIDFNDPVRPGHEVVAEALGMKTEAKPAKAASK